MLIEILGDDIPTFIHPSFAEYFVAKFFFDQLADEKSSETLLHFFTVLTTGECHEGIRAFFNRMLRKEDKERKERGEQKLLLANFGDRVLSDQDGRAIHLAAREGNQFCR